MLGRILAACVLLVLAMPLMAQKAKGKKAKVDQPAVNADKLQPGVFVGKLLSPPGTDGAFTLEVELKTVELKKKSGNSSAKKKQSNLARDQMAIQRQMNAMRKKMARGKLNAADVNRLRKLQSQLARHAGQARPGAAASPYAIKTVQQKVDFFAARDVKVRLLEPAQQFTDKGDIKKFTKAELEQMRGKDRNLPGFEGTLADLRGGQVVRVTQARIAAAKSKDIDNDGFGLEASAHANQVTLIVILGTPAEPVNKVERKRKK